jgi:hypothetical protein
MDAKRRTARRSENRRRTPIRRLVVLVLGVSGLMPLFAQPAHAISHLQQCDPMRRR